MKVLFFIVSHAQLLHAASRNSLYAAHKRNKRSLKSVKYPKIHKIRQIGRAMNQFSGKMTLVSYSLGSKHFDGSQNSGEGT